jgi:hypothetical protein
MPIKKSNAGGIKRLDFKTYLRAIVKMPAWD